MNALTNIVPAKYRLLLYGVMAAVGIALGAAQAGYLASGHQPQWLDVAFGVYGFVSASGHRLAGGNVHHPKPDLRVPPPQDQVFVGGPEPKADPKP